MYIKGGRIDTRNCPPRLDTLEIHGTYEDQSGFVSSLIRSKLLDQISHITLIKTEFSSDNLTLLLQSPRMRNVHSIDLTLNDNISGHPMRAFMCSPHVSNLRKLRLAHSRIVDEDIYEIIESRYLTRLRELDLYGNQYADTESYMALVRSPLMSQLRKLNLPSSAFAKSRRMCEALIEADTRNLELLKIGRGYLTEEDEQMLIDAGLPIPQTSIRIRWM
jgi:hypothetical protein